MEAFCGQYSTSMTVNGITVSSGEVDGTGGHDGQEWWYFSSYVRSVRALLVEMPGAPSSFLLLVLWPGAPSSVLAPSRNALCS